MDVPAVEVPVGDAAQLGLHRAVFGSDEGSGRPRLLAKKIATAVSLAGRGGGAILHLARAKSTNVLVALDAMLEDRGGMLPDSMPPRRLAAVCLFAESSVLDTADVTRATLPPACSRSAPASELPVCTGDTD